jgi:hypothetical protein
MDHDDAPRFVSGESVYDLIKPPPRVAVKGPRHRSKFAGQDTLAHAYSTMPKTKKPMGTMGPAKVPVAGTRDFMRKRAKNFELPEPQPFARSVAVSRKAPVPSRHERPLMGLRTEKNFVQDNAVEQILAVPRRAAQAEYDFTKRPDYGRPPAYLERVREEIGAERAYVQEWHRELQQEEEAASGTAVLSDEEREHLLQGLKERWRRANDSYQTISFSVDMPQKRQKKEELEALMATIEKDIAKLSKQVVIVRDY